LTKLAELKVIKAFIGFLAFFAVTKCAMRRKGEANSAPLDKYECFMVYCKYVNGSMVNERKKKPCH